MPVARALHPMVREGQNLTVKLDDLVGITEAAEYLGATRHAGNQWIRRFEDFPTPILRLRAVNIYSLREIKNWYTRQFPDRSLP